jgi:hypothetical protein
MSGSSVKMQFPDLARLNIDTLNALARIFKLEVETAPKPEKVELLSGEMERLQLGGGGSGGGGKGQGEGGSGGGGGGDGDDDEDDSDDDDTDDEEDETPVMVNLKQDWGEGKTWSVMVLPWWTAGTLKNKVKNLTGIPRRELQLIFGAKVLEDGKALVHYTIQNDDTVHIQLTICGGGKRGRKQQDGSDEGDENRNEKYKITSMDGAEMTAKEGDAAIIVSSLTYDFKPKDWVNTLSVEQLKTLDEILLKYQGRDAQDTTVRAVAQMVKEVMLHEDCLLYYPRKACFTSW